MIDFQAQGRCAAAACDNPVTTGSVGIAVHFHFSADWNELQKVAVFRAGDASVDVVLTGDNAVVPSDVLTVPGLPLMIGVYGMSTDGEIVIPTVWAKAAIIKAGTQPSGIDPSEPAPSWQAQVQEMATEALAKATAVEEAAARGDFDGENGTMIWYTEEKVYDAASVGHDGSIPRRRLIGPSGITPSVGDYVYGPAVGQTGTPTTIYIITTSAVTVIMDTLCSIVGQDGVSPALSVETITGGHRITIVDASHPNGLTVDVMDGEDATVDATLSHAGEAADAAETGKVKASADFHEAELLALSPVIGSDSFTWAIGTYWNSSGVLTAGNGWSHTNKVSAKPGDVVQDLSPDTVSVSGNNKTAQMFVHEWNGDTWLRRTQLAYGEYAVIGANTTQIGIVWGFPAAQSVTITQTIIDNNLAVRIVQKASSGGGGGTSDYTDLTNKPQINGVTLSGNKSASDLSLGTYSKPSGGIPKTDLESAVQTSLGKADTALQQHQSLAAYRTASDQDLIDQQIAGAIPTKTSDLQNDSGFLTQHQSLSAYRTASDQDTIDAGKADKVTEVTNSSAGDVVATLDPGKIYHFTGAISSLTLTLGTPGSGQLAQYHLDFDSGSTAATISISGVTWPGGSFTPEASTHYEVDVLNGYGIYLGWEVTP